NFKTYVLILSGLMGSSAAMAAGTVMTGDAISGSGATGTVNITGTVTSSTCSVSLDQPWQNIYIARSQFTDPGVSNGSVVSQPYSTITFTGCNGQNIKATIQAQTVQSGDAWYGKFPQVDTSFIRYVAGFSGEGVTGGNATMIPGAHLAALDGTDGGKQPVTIAVNSDDYKLKVLAGIVKQAIYADAGQVPSLIQTSYTYKLTYL
ncbi:hypothetical protein IFF17_004582, partial [Salmonella enterica]|nr:hypothetical protein [Salmonella enterica]